MTLLHQWNLMHTCMSSEYSVFIEIVSICWLPAYVISRNEKSVKAVFGLYYWIKVLKNFELLVFNF